MTIYFLITDAGGGHRATANALKDRLINRGLSANIKIVNIYQEIIHECDPFKSWLGIQGENIYNRIIIGKSYYWMAKPAYYALKLLRKIYRRKLQSKFEKYWIQNKPSMVISFAPYLNKLIHVSLQKTAATAPFVVIFTDPEEWASNIWFGSLQSYYLCPTVRAYEQAISFGIPAEKLFLMSGIILNPKFYLPKNLIKTEILNTLGLSNTMPTGLISFGKVSSKRKITNILKNLAQLNIDFQVIILCGDSSNLYDYIQSISTPFKKYVSGWTNEIASYMQVSDFFVGKPGSGSVNEALQMQLPVITEYNFFTMPQEKSVANFIENHQFGICIKSFSRLGKTIIHLLENHSTFKQNLLNYRNNAVFEAAEFIESIRQANYE